MCLCVYVCVTICAYEHDQGRYTESPKPTPCKNFNIPKPTPCKNFGIPKPTSCKNFGHRNTKPLNARVNSASAVVRAISKNGNLPL